MLVLTALGLKRDKRAEKLSEKVSIHGVVKTNCGGRLKVETPAAPAPRRALR